MGGEEGGVGAVVVGEEGDVGGCYALEEFGGVDAVEGDEAAGGGEVGEAGGGRERREGGVVAAEAGGADIAGPEDHCGGMWGIG